MVVKAPAPLPTETLIVLSASFTVRMSFLLSPFTSATATAMG